MASVWMAYGAAGLVDGSIDLDTCTIDVLAVGD